MNDYIYNLTTLAMQGDADAIFELAVRQLEGDGTKQDLQSAYDNFTLLSENGYEDATVMLGKMYCHGLVGEEYLNLGAQILIDASDNGNPLAQYELGYIFEHGIGCNKNIQNALELYSNAAEAGFEPAEQALASLQQRLYRSKTYTPTSSQLKHPQQNTQNRQLSANEAFIIGLNYLEGNGVEKNISQAEKYLKAASNAGHAEASLQLGVLATQGALDIKSGLNSLKLDNAFRKFFFQHFDFSLAKLFFEKAVSQGSTKAYYFLAMSDVLRA